MSFVVLPNSVMVPVSGITFFGSGADLSNHFVSGPDSDVKTMCVKKDEFYCAYVIKSQKNLKLFESM